ncbi:MAG: hypothetical protein ACR2PF_12660 [Rhizobiaceae bacterium]
MGNTDRADGIAKKINGTIREAVGIVTGGRRTEAGGEAEQLECDVQTNWRDPENKA